MDVLIDEWWAQILKRRKCSGTSKTVKAILSYPREVQDQAYIHIPNHIRKGILEVRQSKDVNKMVDLAAAIIGCFDNFSHASDSVNIAFNDVINFIDATIDDCKNMLPITDNVQMRKVKWLELIHYLARILLLVLKLRRPLILKRSSHTVPGIEPYDKKVLFGLSYKLSHFFKVKEILMDTKRTLAMAALLLREILVGDKAKLVEYHKSFLATLPESIKEQDYELNVYKLLFANAILKTWCGTVVDETSTQAYLRFFIQLCESYSSDTGIILNISRTLLFLIKNECFIDFMDKIYKKEFDLVDPLLSCVYMLLDHPVPRVRYSSKDLPKLLVRHDDFMKSMMDALALMNPDKRSYFICCSAVASSIEPQPWISADGLLKENLFSALREPSLVTYVIDALHAVILKDYSNMGTIAAWCERWIVPLLLHLHKGRTTAVPEIEKMLQIILSRAPGAIAFIIFNWGMPKNDEELRYLITALKVYNKLIPRHREELFFGFDNILDSFSEGGEKREGLISEELLVRCLMHNDDDVRVSAFALIVETVKSTEIYSRNDFELIKYSLKYNMSNHEPATRQKFLSLVRKMMTRFADSLAVIERKLEVEPTDEANYNKGIYVSFREWLLDFSFSNIYQNSNFNRLHTILSILLDYTEIIKEVKIDTHLAEDYFKGLLVPLRSSFEDNKKMAILLAKKMKVLQFYKNTAVVRMIFNNALDLCGKIEPPNALTGAYLIQYLLKYPLLDRFLSEHSKEISYCSVEHFVILLLSNKLEEQIRRAEKNLIEAVTDNSMYGTLFAIRLVLQETDFSPVTDNPESERRTEIQRCWSEVLRKLIEFSFRMIKVVSCVVNSSSPEGHLPSDFQTDLDLACHEFLGERNKESAERDLRATTSGFRRIKLCEAKSPRTRSIIFEDCDRVLTYYNNVFLSHGESRSFTKKNAMVFENILTETTKLISELEAIEMPSDQESECLRCLRTVETRVKNYIAIYEDNRQRYGKPTAQMLLLCSWRSIKEACLFLGDLVSRQPLKTWIESGLLTEEIILTIGVELRKLLCEIKHRGAFEHAYVGFTSLVTAFWECPIKNLNELPQKWLEEILREIQQPVKDQKIKFCSNRRSAGLPFLVQAIICSELKCTNAAKIHTFDITMNNLLVVAEDDSATEESIIHSLNILRALFKHAMLGEYVAPYVCQGVMIAIKASRSPAWGIRNSACLLFSALMIRIFGVARDKDVLSKKNRMTAKHFIQRYPELYQFFLNEIELEFNCSVQSLQSTTTIPSPEPHLFLIFLILGRLYSSPIEDKADIDFSEFFPYINASCCNPTFKIRELGARALVPLISSDTFIQALEFRFSNLKLEDGENNRIHGTLFQIKNILLEIYDKKKLYVEPIRERAENWIEDTHTILDLALTRTPYMIKIVYIQILHLLFKIDVNIREKIYKLLKDRDVVESGDENDGIREEIPGRSAYLEIFHFVRFDIAADVCAVTCNKDYMMQLLFSMLASKHEEVQIVALSFLKFITSTRYDDLPEEEESKLISVKLQDMLCVEDEKKLSVVSTEIVSDKAVINYVLDSFVTLLNNANDTDYLLKMTTRLKVSVISNFMLGNIISAHNIYEVCDTTTIPNPVMDLLADIIKCSSSEISVGAFICFGILFFENIKNNVALSPQTVLYFRRLMFSYSGANADVKQKIAVCEIFIKYYDFYIHNFFKTDSQAMSIWMLPFRLLSDENPQVRRQMVEFVYKYQDFCRKYNRHEAERLVWDFDDDNFSFMVGTPYKAQESLVECYISLLDIKDLIHLFVPMVAFMLSAYINTMNSEFTYKQNEDGLFERGNPNPFCEDMTFGSLLCRKLKQFSLFTRIMLSRQLEQTHIDSLKEFFPTLVFVNFPDKLLDFCVQIVKILSEEYSKDDLTLVSFLPVYIAELVCLNITLNIEAMKICNRYPKELLHYDNCLKRRCLRKFKDNVWESKTKWHLLVKAEWTYRYKLLLSHFRLWLTYTKRKIRRKNKIRDADSHYSRKMKYEAFSMFKKNGEERLSLVKNLRSSIQLKIMRKNWNCWEKYVRKNLKAKEVAALTIKTRELFLIKTYIGLWLINCNEKIYEQKLFANAEAHHNRRTKVKTIKVWRDYFMYRRKKKELATCFFKNLQLKLKNEAFKKLMEYSRQKKLYRKHVQTIALFYENYVLKNVLDIWSNRYEDLMEFRSKDKNNLATKIYNRKLFAKYFRKLKIWSYQERARHSATERFISVSTVLKIQFCLEIWRKRLYDRLLSNSMEIKASTWRNFYLKKMYLSTLMELLEKKKEENSRVEDSIRYCNFKILSKTLQGWQRFIQSKREKRSKGEEVRRYYENRIVQKLFEKLRRYAVYKIHKNSVVTYYERTLVYKAFRDLRNFSEIKKFHRHQIACFRDRRRRQILLRAFYIFKHRIQIVNAKMRDASNMSEKKTQKRVLEEWKNYCEIKRGTRILWNTNKLRVQEVIMREFILTWWKNTQSQIGLREDLKRFKINQDKRLVKRFFGKWLNIREKFTLIKENVLFFNNLRSDIILQYYIIRLVFLWKERTHEREKKVLADVMEKGILLRRFFKQWVSYVNWKMKKLKECSTKVGFLINETDKLHNNYYHFTPKSKRKQPMIPAYLRGELALTFQEETFS